MKHQVGWAIAAAAAITGALTPSHAAACGGFFCQSAPMDQAGEKILFSVEDDGTLVTHVQILYQGEADAFAWILPLPSVPTSIGVGSDALFTQLGNATRPQFYIGAQRTEGTCRATPDCPYDGRYDTDTAYPGAYEGARTDAAAAADAGAGVTVYLRETVGPYDSVVLGSASADELFLWLDENGYDIPEISRPIVAEYVAARHVFVAVRLVSGADTREIQPLVLRYREAQPCVPMRLTAIATVPDMPITAYFAAGRLATPNNYVRLEPSYAEPRLWSDSSYFDTYVSNAIDDAGGRAWITDYAGSMPAIALALPAVDDLRTVTDPGQFVQMLQGRGFSGDSQLLGILMRFLPPPETYAGNPQQYYNCLWSSWMSAESCGYTGGFDPDGLVTALTAQIVEPRRDAQAILDRQPRLTRLYTTMSAEDMTIDPTFSLDDGLPEVSNVHQATLVTECSREYFEWSAPQRLELPGGTTARWRDGVGYPGTDTAYCEDLRTGDFAPWTSIDVRRETARRRAITAGGGGPICAIAPGGAAGSRSVGALLALGLALALWITRRQLK